MLHLLTHLHHGPPRVLRRQNGAVGTLTILNHELDLKDLLQDRRREHLLLHRQLDSKTLAVRLGPDETSVDEPHLVETFELLETDGEELSRLETRGNPRVGWIQVALAVSAEVDRRLLGDRLGDVDRVSQTRKTEVGIVGRDGVPQSAQSTMCCAAGGWYSMLMCPRVWCALK